MQQALGLLRGACGRGKCVMHARGQCTAGPGAAGGWLGARKMCDSMLWVRQMHDAHRGSVYSRPWSCRGVAVSEANV